MIEEISAIEDLKVWKQTDAPDGACIIGVKWVLKEKLATSSTSAKFKAR